MAEGATGEDLHYQGRLDEAEEACERALVPARQAGPRCYLPNFLYNCGWTALRQGRLDRATASLDESIAVARELGDALCLAIALPLRGTVSMLRHDLDQAQTYLLEAERVSDDLGARGLLLARIALGRLALLQGDPDGAAMRFGTALEDAAHIGARIMIGESLQGLAFVATARGDARTAAQLLAAEGLLRASISQRRPPEDQDHVDATLARLREALGEVEFEAAWQAGQHLSLDWASAYAHSRATPRDPKPVARP